MHARQICKAPACNSALGETQLGGKVNERESRGEGISELEVSR